MTATKYSLNLSKRYVADWGAWEVAREIICNALDAAPDDLSIHPKGADELIVSTPTVPDLSELFIIGEGTKAVGGDTIGQFGEGLKLAALVATRSGGSLTLNLPNKRVTFSFENVMDVDVLHAKIDDEPNGLTGYVATIRMTGVSTVYAGRLLADRSSGPQPKHGKDLTIFVKGIFVSLVDAESIWNWNLNKLKINRDRSMVSTSEICYRIGDWLEDHMTGDMADQIVAATDDEIEANEALELYHGGNTKRLLPPAFKRLHGDNAVTKSDIQANNERARADGMNPVSVSDGIRRAIRWSIRSADEWKIKAGQLQSLDYAPFKSQIDTLRTLDKLIDAPLVKVCVFEPEDDALFSYADRAERIVWLSKRLFTDGEALLLTRTYLHEMAHIISQAEDCTRKFEDTLDDLNGRLAMHILGGKS